jgi:rhodanese-related sulfurtransferase
MPNGIWTFPDYQVRVRVWDHRLTERLDTRCAERQSRRHPCQEGDVMATTFGQMVGEASAAVSAGKAAVLKQRFEQDPHALLVDVRDFESRRASGMIPGAVAVSHGALLYKADQEVPPEWRDPQLQDRSRPVVTHCDQEGDRDDGC